MEACPWALSGVKRPTGLLILVDLLGKSSVDPSEGTSPTILEVCGVGSASVTSSGVWALEPEEEEEGASEALGTDGGVGVLNSTSVAVC